MRRTLIATIGQWRMLGLARHRSRTVPKHHSGVASFVIRAADRTAWRSAATAAWLIVENEGAYRVDNGTVLVVTECARDVAYFHVRQVMSGRG